MDYGFYIKQQDKKIKELRLLFREAMDQLEELSAKNEKLEEENIELKKILASNKIKAVKKTSRNSDLPPSKDIGRGSNKVKDSKSSKASGGQVGHKGHTLEMIDNPDKTISLIPDHCFKCGKLLRKGDKTLDYSQQVFDIPPVQHIVTQYDSYKITCDCGQCNIGTPPDQVSAKTQYGPGIRSWISYLSTYQFLSYPRTQDFFRVAFNINLSQGTIYNAIKRTAKKALGLYQFIQEFLTISPVVGADETIIRVDGQKYYIWVWQNDKATFIIASDNRRKDNIYEYFPHGFPCAALVSDRYAAHLSTPADSHQICWAHIIRHCKYLMESENNAWVTDLLDLYQRAKILEQLNMEDNPDLEKEKKLEADLNRLLFKSIDSNKYPLTKKLQKSFIENRKAIFTFVYHKKVPSHNNASEIAIRNFKVKMKVSGQFKSAQHYYVIIRSIIDTLIKNKKPIFNSLLRLESDQPVTLGLAL